MHYVVVSHKWGSQAQMRRFGQNFDNFEKFAKLERFEKFENLVNFWKWIKILKNERHASNARHMCHTYSSKICASFTNIARMWNTRQMGVMCASYIFPCFHASFKNDTRASMRLDTRDSTRANEDDDDDESALRSNRLACAVCDTGSR